PRTSVGNGRGSSLCGLGAGAAAGTGVPCRWMCVASTPPTTPAPISARMLAAATSLRRRISRRRSRRRILKRSLGSTGWRIEEQEDLPELVEITGLRAFVLHPGEFDLGSTLERIRLPDDLVARLDGKSSLGRLGLLIHSTAGFVDPGWNGHVTLELSNVANLP